MQTPWYEGSSRESEEFDTFVECTAIIIIVYIHSLILVIQTNHLLFKMLMPLYSFFSRRSNMSRGLMGFTGQSIEANKAKLLLLISGLVVAVLLPAAILPRINHPFLVYRTSIHLASISISVFLIVVSILTYKRTGSVKILYTSVAFLSLLVVEMIFLLQIVDGSNRIMIPLAYSELPHIFLLTMLALFGIGVLRVEK